MSTGEIIAAAQWLVDNWDTAVERSLIGAVREHFGVEVGTAAKVVAEARKLREAR